jgi:hypothetical protein
LPATGVSHASHTVLGDAALNKGEIRTLDFLYTNIDVRLITIIKSFYAITSMEAEIRIDRSFEQNK